MSATGSASQAASLLEKVDLSSLTPKYQILAKISASICAGDDNLTSLLSNLSALLWEQLKDINWAGFYLLHQEEQTLYLGPFQGKAACRRIAFGKGVCGTAVAETKTQLVPNVHDFPGHIACDSVTNSEIVIPIFLNDKVVGVLDIDSPEFNRFNPEDAQGLEVVVQILQAQLATLNPLQFAVYDCKALEQALKIN